MTGSDELLNKQFLEMLEQHSNIIIKVSRACTVVAQDREDLMNDIALELWKSFRSFRGECKVSTWM
ncbi:MAG: sigma-70 family RNA polymerase sigma factor, partial [Bacteroidia bacterium]|nr:sigma-70 family RNA polymerase sigma factor [Bacteroidia bacterium]